MSNNKGLNHNLWRFLADFWAILTLLLFIIEVFALKRSDTLANIASIIYVAVLSIYAGRKEYRRWRHEHWMSLHWGETFVLYWTFLMFTALIFCAWWNVKLPEGLIATYVAIISIFALTSKSKYLYYKKKSRK